MKQEINPQETNRAIAFELWMKSPMPLPQRLAEDHAPYLVPIPSLSNGRHTRCPISGKITENNKHNIK